MDERGPRLLGFRRRARKARKELARSMEWPGMLESDERGITRPPSVLWPAARCAWDVEVDVTARGKDILVLLQEPAEEPMTDEMALPCQPVDDVDAPGEPAVQLPHPIGEAAACELNREVVVVEHERPRERDPPVLVRRTLVEPKEQLVFEGSPENGLPIVSAGTDVVAAGRIDDAQRSHRSTLGSDHPPAHRLWRTRDALVTLV